MKEPVGKFDVVLESLLADFGLSVALFARFATQVTRV